MERNSNMNLNIYSSEVFAVWSAEFIKITRSRNISYDDACFFMWAFIIKLNAMSIKWSYTVTQKQRHDTIA